MGNLCAKQNDSPQPKSPKPFIEGQNYEDLKNRLKERNENENENEGTKILFEDDKFRPGPSSLGSEIDDRYPNIDWIRNIEWIRVPELPYLKLAKQTPYVYYSDGEKSRKHCMQGKLGNCWFCAVATALSANVKLYAKEIHNLECQTFKDEEYFGIFHFRFYHLGEWTDVVIDDYLPTLEGKLIFAHSKDPNEFWPALLEKACAKYLGSYEKLWSGDPLDAGINFSGGFSERYELVDHQTDDKIQKLFEDLSEANKISSIITCTTYSKPKDDDGKIDELEKKRIMEVIHIADQLGLKDAHAYTITKLCQFNDETLVRIRNPWGEKEWIGAWSDYSDEMKALKPRHKKSFGIETDNDGEFYMTMSDFVKYFQNVQVVAQKPKEFHNVPVYKEQFKGSWKTGSSGGGSSNPARNPQYLIKYDGTDHCKSIVALSQATKGIKERLYIGFHIYEVKDEIKGKTGMRLGQEYFKEKKFVTNKWWDAREVMSEPLTMTPGSTYVIVPSTHKPDQEGDFLLRFVSDKPLIHEELKCPE